MAGEVTPGLRALLAKQQCFAVEYFGADSSAPDYRDRDTADLADAHVVSSAVRETWNTLKPAGEVSDDNKVLAELFDGFLEYEEVKHIVVLDIDHPTHVVDSSTPGHHHLYVEIPPAPAEDYFEFLRAAAKIGLIQQGYADVSVHRGHSDVRLPWIRKGEPGDIPTPWGGKDFQCFRCGLEPQQISEYRDQAQQQKDEGSVATKSGVRPVQAGEPTEVNDYDIKAWVWHNEGTLDRETGLFACTECYIAIGMPSSPTGWKPTWGWKPDSSEIPVVDMSPLT